MSTLERDGTTDGPQRGRVSLQRRVTYSRAWIAAQRYRSRRATAIRCVVCGRRIANAATWELNEYTMRRIIHCGMTQHSSARPYRETDNPRFDRASG